MMYNFSVVKNFGDDKMSEFDLNSMINSLVVLCGEKFCAKDIVDCDVDRSDLKYDEKCYSVSLHQDSTTKSANDMCFISNPKAPKKRISQ